LARLPPWLGFITATTQRSRRPRNIIVTVIRLRPRRATATTVTGRNPHLMNAVTHAATMWRHMPADIITERMAGCPRIAFATSVTPPSIVTPSSASR